MPMAESLQKKSINKFLKIGNMEVTKQEIQEFITHHQKELLAMREQEVMKWITGIFLGVEEDQEKRKELRNFANQKVKEMFNA